MKALRISNKITNIETKSFKNYLNEIASIDVFTPEEEAECAMKAANGDKKAIDELIVRNLKFVVSVAKQYETNNVSLEDLINEGNLGLIMAVNEYNPTTGFKFITYAVHWIRKMILEYLTKNARLIRLPSNKVMGLNKYNQQLAILEQKNHRSADVSEVAKELSNVMSIDEIMDLSLISTIKFDSLDNPIGDNDTNSFMYETIQDSEVKPTDYLITDADLKKQIMDVLNILKPTERDIITMLFGLDGSTPMNLKDVGDKIGLTRERVRQIKEKCLKELKKSFIL